MGRFLTPDWAAIPEPVPYSKFNDPQTLTLYAYVGNNPLARYDSDGHDVILMVWAMHDGNIGHFAVAISNYKQVSVQQNGKTVTKMVPDGTYTYKDLWPGGAGAGKSNCDKNLPGVYQTKNATESNLINTDVSGSEQRPSDGVLKISTDYASDQKTLGTLSDYASSHPDYNGVSNNCCGPLLLWAEHLLISTVDSVCQQ